MKATVNDIKAFDDVVLHQDLDEPTVQLIHDIVHGKTTSQSDDVNEIAKKFVKHYQEREFLTFIEKSKELEQIAKDCGMSYGFELQPKIHSVYYKACEKKAKKCDLSDQIIDSQSKKLAHEKRNLSEAMGSLLKLTKHNPYFAERYQSTLKKIGKDRDMLNHRSMILKMKKKLRKKKPTK